jgi:hypothetical protein
MTERQAELSSGEGIPIRFQLFDELRRVGSRWRPAAVVIVPNADGSGAVGERLHASAQP